MQTKRTWLLLGAGVLLAIGTEASAQSSGIPITKDRAISNPPSATNTMPTANSVNGGEVVTQTAFINTPFSLASYANMTEGNIVAHMAAGDSLEIALASMAQLKATDQRVRQYAATLAGDHREHLVNTLGMVTDEHILPAPMASDPEGARLKEAISSLRTMSAGPAWDAAFLRFNVSHHQNELDLLAQNIKNAHDDDLEDHIEDTQKALTRHRDMARSIATQLGVSLP